MKNVILLTIDALRADHTQPYGYTRATTPFLTELSKKSVLFSNAFSTGPYTQASFPGILTSTQYLDIDDKKKLSKQRTLISELLKKHGVTTAAFHSNPYLSGFFGYNRGWDQFYDSMETDLPVDCPYETAASINARAENWLTEWREENADRSQPQPFFLWMHYMDVHEPYIPSQENLSKINPDLQITLEEMTSLFKNTLLARKVDDTKDIDTLRDLYDAQILDADNALQHFFTYLENSNILKDTVVIITADHGDEFNEHGGLSHDAKMYNELIRVPLLIYNSDEDAQRCATVASTIDLGPTILKLFGIDNPVNYQGQSILPLTNYSRTHCLSEAVDKDTNESVQSVQNATQKIITYSNGTTEYYSADPTETSADPVEDAPNNLREVLNTFSSRKMKPHESQPKKTDDLLNAAENIDL